MLELLSQNDQAPNWNLPKKRKTEMKGRNLLGDLGLPVYSVRGDAIVPDLGIGIVHTQKKEGVVHVPAKKTDRNAREKGTLSIKGRWKEIPENAGLKKEKVATRIEIDVLVNEIMSEMYEMKNELDAL